MVEVLAIDVRIGRVVGEAGGVERPLEVGRAVEPRAAVPRDRASEPTLEIARAHSIPAATRARAPQGLAAMLEPVAEDLRAPSGAPSARTAPADGPRDDAEGGRMSAARHAGEQPLEPGGVGVLARLDVVREHRRRLEGRRPAREAHQLAAGAPDERPHQLDHQPAGRVDRVGAGALTEPLQAALEAAVAPACTTRRTASGAR